MYVRCTSWLKAFQRSWKSPSFFKIGQETLHIKTSAHLCGSSLYRTLCSPWGVNWALRNNWHTAVLWEKCKKGGRVREAEATFDCLDYNILRGGRQSRLLAAFRLNRKFPCIRRMKRERSYQKCYAAQTRTFFSFFCSDFLHKNQHYFMETYKEKEMQLHTFLI